MYDRDVRAGRWHYLSAGRIRRAADLTLGIVGLGRIGKRFAYLARNCFGRVLACDPYLIDGDFPAYVERATLMPLFESADVVSLHVPLTAETRGLVDAALLGRIRPGAVLVNTARGGIVDEQALAAALAGGRLSAAGIDVFEREPVPADNPLLHLPNVVVTPHIGSATTATRARMADMAAANAIAALQGQVMPCCVNPHVYA
jgi:D-3-phosphoglycerate dehydrogenase